MNELPKELTPELLGLVLGVHDVKEIDKVPFTDELTYAEDCEDIRVINIDTLTRLMIEYITKQDYELDIATDRCNNHSIEIMEYCMDDNELGCFKCATNSDDTMFETVLKATDWVIREKGLLKEIE